MTGLDASSGAGTAAAAVLWAAALRLASDVRRHSPDGRRGTARPDATEFAAEWGALLGHWRGQEASAGAFASDLVASFDYELDGGVLTHRATGGLALETPAGAGPHEMMMTFFPRAGGRAADAVRYDNAGQALQLEATWSADGRALAMTSLREPGEACWRWTWRLEDARTLHTLLERAEPGRGDFATQSHGTLRRTA